MYLVITRTIGLISPFIGIYNNKTATIEAIKRCMKQNFIPFEDFCVYERLENCEMEVNDNIPLNVTDFDFEGE